MICCFIPSIAAEQSDGIISANTSLLVQDLGINVIQGNTLVANQNPKTPETVKIKLPKKGYGDGFCVSYAKFVSGSQHNGNAYEWKEYIDTQIPTKGAVVVLQEGPVGHLAVVVEVRENTILITEQNFNGRWVIDQRELATNNPDILGYVLD